MTTHEQQARVPNSYDEGQTPTAATRPVTEHTAPTQAGEPSVLSSAPAPDAGQEQFRDTPAPVAGQEQYGQEQYRDAPAAPSQEQWQPPVDAPAAGESHVSHESATAETLFADDDLTELRGRWAAVQAAFVDDPKDCVQKADVLVSDLVDQLTSGFAQARSRLEEQWARGQEASTEDLRLALMHYREFFERLLAV